MGTATYIVCLYIGPFYKVNVITLLETVTVNGKQNQQSTTHF